MTTYVIAENNCFVEVWSGFEPVISILDWEAQIVFVPVVSWGAMEKINMMYARGIIFTHIILPIEILFKILQRPFNGESSVRKW